MINREKADFAISSFSGLEKQLIDCMEYLPFIDANKQAISPKFIPIIMDSCSLVDSVLREFSANGDDRKFSMKEYSKENENDLRLENNATLFLTSPVKLLRPFKGWTNHPPSWWDAYNNLKHDRLNNFHYSTFSHAVEAMGGLHQLLARRREFIGGFLKAGWINVAEETSMHLTDVSNVGIRAEIVIESKLFASPSNENFVNPEKSTDDYFDIDYSANGLSDRIRNMIYGHEEWS